MRKDLRTAEIHQVPIEDWVGELANTKHMPRMAIDACLARPVEAAPLLRQLLIEATADGIPDDPGRADQLFRAIHLLGGMRDTDAFRPLLAFLQGPVAVLDDFLGDMTTETLPRIVIGIFDGNVEALFRAIERPRTESSIRGSLLEAAAFLAWEGRIDRDRMTNFLERLDVRPRQAGDGLLAHGWSVAISLLGLRSLAPLVYRAVEKGILDDALFFAEDFEDTLGRAEKDPEDPSRFEESGLFPIEDVAEELAAFAWSTSLEDRLSPYFDDGEDGADLPGGRGPFVAAVETVINPLRGVGRNDPCPCGSGKKAKRCCLAS